MDENGNRERTRALGINKTIADNHLSEGSLGRFGDTEMYKTKSVRPGSEWHVNPKEKQLMNMRGAEGEKLVDAMGSGTINPYTGKEEKWVIAAATLGLGAYSAWKGGQSASQHSQYEKETAQSGIESLDLSEGQLRESKESQKGAIFQQHSMDTEKLSAEIGIRKEDLDQQTATAIKQSDLATSGTIEQKRSTAWGRIQGAFGRGQKSLMASLGEKMGKLEGWFEGEMARIGSERKKFQQVIDLAKEKQKSWYLGKNIFG